MALGMRLATACRSEVCWEEGKGGGSAMLGGFSGGAGSGRGEEEGRRVVSTEPSGCGGEGDEERRRVGKPPVSFTPVGEDGVCPTSTLGLCAREGGAVTGNEGVDAAEPRAEGRRGVMGCRGLAAAPAGTPSSGGAAPRILKESPSLQLPGVRGVVGVPAPKRGRFSRSSAPLSFISRRTMVSSCCETSWLACSSACRRFFFSSLSRSTSICTIWLPAPFSASTSPSLAHVLRIAASSSESRAFSFCSVCWCSFISLISSSSPVRIMLYSSSFFWKKDSTCFTTRKASAFVSFPHSTRRCIISSFVFATSDRAVANSFATPFRSILTCSRSSWARLARRCVMSSRICMVGACGGGAMSSMKYRDCY
eukprot:Sspe_Gene.34270::Locus_16678_Transcript_1_7_Confidence_0.154_Length_1469::g.34270::m.34270